MYRMFFGRREKRTENVLGKEKKQMKNVLRKEREKDGECSSEGERDDMRERERERESPTNHGFNHRLFRFFRARVHKDMLD